MCLTEDLIYAFGGRELFVDLFCVPFIGKRKLIFQVDELVVDRSCRKHQNFRAHTRPYHLVHQPQISVLFRPLSGDFPSVAEVVAFVNYNQVIIAPIQPLEINPVGLSPFARKIGVIQHIVAEPIFRNRIVDIVAFVGVPVLGQLFGTQHQHGFVSVLVVLDHRKRGKCFAETHAVRQNAAVVFFQLVDDRKHRITLKVVQHPPNLAFLETVCLIRQFIFGDVVQKLVEDIV